MSSAMEALLTEKQYQILLDEIERDVDEGNWWKEEYSNEE